MVTKKRVDLPHLFKKFKRSIILIHILGALTFSIVQTVLAAEKSYLPFAAQHKASVLNQHNPYAQYNPYAIFERYILKPQNVYQNGLPGAFTTVGGRSVSLKWERNIDEAALFTPLINDQGTIGYVVANDVDVESEDFIGKLYAINLADGSVLWKFEIDGLFVARPIVDAEGTVFAVANTATDTTDTEESDINGILLAIDNKGNKKWSFKAEGNIISSPVLAQDGRIFFGTITENGGVLYAINPLAVNDPANVKPDWAFKTKGGIVSSPLITETGTIFASTAGDNNFSHLFAIGIDGGNLKWEFQTTGDALVSPVKKGNVVFMGITVFDESETQVSVTGKIIAFNTEKIDPNNVLPIWERSVNGGIFFQLLVFGDTLYSGVVEVMSTIPETPEDLDDLKDILNDIELPTGSLVAINIADGVVRWTVPLESIPAASPVVGPEGTILITSDSIDLKQKSISARLFAVTAGGNVKFNSKIDGAGVFSAPETDIDGVIYAGLTSFSLRDGIGGRLVAVDFASGKVRSDFNVEANEAILFAPIVDLNDLINEKTVFFVTDDFKGDPQSGNINLFGSIIAVKVERAKVGPEPSTITIDDIDPPNTGLGSFVTVIGEISPSPGVVPVMITFSDQLGRVFREEEFTNSSGIFVSFLLVPGGSWNVTAKWEGNAALSGAVSEPASLTINPANTILTLDVSGTQILSGDLFEIAGSITPDPDSAFARDLLAGRPVKLVRIGPNNEVDSTLVNLGITGEGVQFQRKDAQLFQPGKWKLIASFDENNPNFNKSNLVEREITVIGKEADAAGYAVLVQGGVESKSGLDSHNLSTNLIRQELIACGFKDENIFYFNFDNTQDGVDAIPTEKDVLNAITVSARDKMNLLPAPLYIIMVGHGLQHHFPLFPDDLISFNLESAIEDLQGALNEDAKKEKIIIVLGAPHSGSFINELSGDNRIIVTSSDTREVSFKGPLATTDNVRNGDFFVSQFFKLASKGLSLKNSYEKAAIAAMTFTQNDNGNGLNGVNAGNGSFNDDAAYHPLLDDNGDGVGSNGQLSAVSGSDGALAANTVLCIDQNKSDTVEISEVIPQHLSLAPGDPDPILKAKVTDIGRVDKIWVQIKTPDFKLSFNEDATEQNVLDIPAFAGTLNSAEGQFEWPDLKGQGFGGFGQGGKYQVLYFVKDNVTGDISIFDANISQTTIVRNSDPSTKLPDQFKLKSPADGQDTSIGLGMSWGEGDGGDDNGDRGATSDRRPGFKTAQEIDDDKSDITFTLLISRDETFNTIDSQFNNISENFAIVDTTASLLFGARYFWKVIAVDKNGAFRSASDGRSFVTSTSVGFPGFVKGFVKEKDTGRPILNALVKLLGRSEAFTTQEDGAYFFELPSGNYTFEAENTGFKKLKAAIGVNSFETTTREFLLESETPDEGENSLTVSPAGAGKSLKMQEAVVTMQGANGEPLSGVKITAAANGAGAKVSPSSQTTGSDGAARFKFKFGLRSKNGKIIFSADGLNAVITQE